MGSSIAQVLADIESMQEAFTQPQCKPKLPFVQYPDGEDPPRLKFNIQQTTSFTTYGHILKYFPATYFKAFTKNIPQNNYYEMLKNMNTEQAAQLFAGPPLPVSYPGQPGMGHPAIVGSGVSASGIDMNVRFNNTGGVAGPSSSSFLHTTGESATPGTTHPTAAMSPRDYLSTLKIDRSAAIANSTQPGVLANFAKQDLRPVIIDSIGNRNQVTKYIAKPPVPVPRIVIIEEYTTASYLGDYGAGRVVKTFTLLPGERTTISVRTYKDRVTTVEKSQNVIDSFSESSASELDKLMQLEQGNLTSTSDSSGGSGSSFSTTTDSKNSSKSYGISGSLDLGLASIGGGYGQSESEMYNTSSGFNNTYDYNHTAARQSNINARNSAMDKHVQQSNSNRTIDVNTSTSDVARSGEEETTVRELQNINLNRVLNFTFRQLLQEYISITYLSNVKFAYTNGYPESYTVVDLDNLVNMLTDIIEPAHIDEVLCKLLSPYCSVLDYQDTPQAFVKKMVVPFNNCLQLDICALNDETFYRRDKSKDQTYEPLDVTVPGIILNVQTQTLRTSSIIGDALLGAGDALDCFNQNAQNASNQADYIRNMQAMQDLEDSIQTTANDQLYATKELAAMEQQRTIVDSIAATGDVNAVAAAEKYKKVYGDCCDVPQSCCGGGCGCDCKDEPVTP